MPACRRTVELRPSAPTTRRGVDQPRVAFRQDVVAESQGLHGSWLEVGQDHVARGGQLLEQGDALGVPQVHRTVDVGHHHARRDPVLECHRDGDHRVVVTPRRRHSCARIEQRAFYAELLGLGHAPRQHALAANAILELARCLEHHNSQTVACECAGKRRTADPAADDQHITGSGHRVKPP